MVPDGNYKVIFVVEYLVLFRKNNNFLSFIGIFLNTSRKMIIQE
ncbi:hypothetical protein CLERM_802 [Coxiella-like endosymbiont]|nr:hypothetical protein CLERM_802 [Coxiella-like endosymbiont]